MNCYKLGNHDKFVFLAIPMEFLLFLVMLVLNFK